MTRVAKGILSCENRQESSITRVYLYFVFTLLFDLLRLRDKIGLTEKTCLVGAAEYIFFSVSLDRAFTVSPSLSGLNLYVIAPGMCN